METNKEEALKAKQIAEQRFAEKDFPGARSYALKAKTLWPGLDGISQMVATFEVYLASAVRVNGEVDYYSILGLKPSADRYSVKKQYKKLAVLLHPDKNKCVGADGAFKLVSEAWTLLSDNTRKGSYDLKRSHHVASHATGVTSHNNCHNSSAPQRLDTFWTVCTSCKVQYEYLRKYVNKRLSCKNCRGIFVAVETGTAPVSGAFPYCPYTYLPSNGYAKSEGVPYVTNSATYYPGNGLHSGQGYEYGSNVSFQWSANGSSSMAAPSVHPSNGKSQRGNKDRSGNTNARGRHSTKSFSPSSNGLCLTKSGRPDKRRKVIVGADFRNGPEVKHSPESQSNGGRDPKVSAPIELPTRRCSAAPLFDARKLLADKARSEICKKLVFLKIAVKEEEKKVGQVNGGDKEETQKGHSRPRSGPVSITVPDPDFHDFDKDRTEECFKPKQIWALYDEEDGMPRLYCLIREIISTNPFKILITYLSSKSDSEFGAVNWLDCGFTKSCGNFRAFNSEVIEQVNIFSHILSKEKAGRGGCVRLYPRSGDIWAVYRNWSPNWDRSTPPEVRHQYEMVEVVDDYSEELGVCVTPLVKMSGYKTVYQRDKDSVRWIPRREMLRFSHQVPSCGLKPDIHGLPEGSWDLDPAATPDELLHEGIEVEGTEV